VIPPLRNGDQHRASLAGQVRGRKDHVAVAHLVQPSPQLLAEEPDQRSEDRRNQPDPCCPHDIAAIHHASATIICGSGQRLLGSQRALDDIEPGTNSVKPIVVAAIMLLKAFDKTLLSVLGIVADRAKGGGHLHVRYLGTLRCVN
jgi:hypothetical protein